MRLLTISNLFPRPDRPTLGIFNAQLFAEVAKLASVRNVCLVPEWRFWRGGEIRRWQAPSGPAVATRYEPVFHVPVFGRNRACEFYALSLDGRLPELKDCDAVLAAWLYPDGAAVTALAQRAGVPAWILVQGSDTLHLTNPRRKKAIMACAAHAAGFLCVCRLLADRLVQAGVPAGKVHVVRNGVDAGRFRPLPRGECEGRLRQTAGVRLNADGWKRILFVGNLVPVKGPDIALDALGELARTGGRVDAELVCVGDGPMRRRLEATASERGLSGRVHFAGARPHDEIADWMNVADLLMLSSRSEGMPNVVLEALACGLPVVASDVGACSEMLAGEPRARVVPANDAAAMAAAVRELLAEETDRQALAARHGRRSWSDMAREVVERMKAEA